MPTILTWAFVITYYLYYFLIPFSSISHQYNSFRDSTLGILLTSFNNCCYYRGVLSAYFIFTVSGCSTIIKNTRKNNVQKNCSTNNWHYNSSVLVAAAHI